MSTSVKKNFLYSSILTVSSYLFPIITYPYVSRVLGVTNIGICNFVDSIITYFCMFSTLGLSVTGIREIAGAKGDHTKISHVFSSLLALSGITTIISLVVLLISIYVVPQFREHSHLMYIGVVRLIFNFLLIEWFYKGLEDFKYITNRAIAIKILYVIAIFVFIRTPEDYWRYYAITVASIVINSLINLIHTKKYVTFSLKGIDFRPFIIGFIVMGIYNLVSSLYTTFNVSYLGLVTDTTQVGYYATAHKLYGIIIALYTAFTGVMMPRMSSLLSDGRIEEFKKYISKSTNCLITFGMPIVIVSVFFSKEIIQILSGAGYEGAVIPMQIMMPLVIIIGYEQILIIQTLMPLKKDKIIFRNSVAGAIVGLCLNFMLVGKYGAIGSAIVWISCEIVVLILSQMAVRKEININFPYHLVFQNIIVGLPLIVICALCRLYICNAWISIIVASILTSVYFLTVQLLFLKNELIVNSLTIISKKISKHNRD